MRGKAVPSLLFGGLVAAFAVVMAAPACDSDGGRIDRSAVLQDLVDKVMLPSLADFETRAETLEAAVGSFCDAPGAEALSDARTAWRDARSQWKRVELYDFARTMSLGTWQAIDSPRRCGSWIERVVDGDADDSAGDPADCEPSDPPEIPDDIDASFVEASGSGVRGLPELAHLLFAPVGPDDDVLSAYQDAPDAQRRCDLARAIATFTHDRATAIHDAWRPDGGGFGESLATAGRGSEMFTRLQEGVDVVVTRAVHMLTILADNRLARIAGLRAESGEPEPQWVATNVAEHGKADLLAVLEGFESLYTGDYGDNEGLGIGDMVEARKGAVDELVREDLETSRLAIEAIPDPLHRAATESTETVKAARAAVNQLRIRVDVDASELLGVVVSVNEGDTD